MDEYVIDVIMDDEPEQLKSYAHSLYAAIDNMVALGSVQSIVKIFRTEDKKEWDFNNGTLERLRELRDEIISESDLVTELNKYNECD
tara:strand:+ start:828 stop:1088 length:261 start_codon:yes stop_codon:yes gene_type:complete